MSLKLPLLFCLCASLLTAACKRAPGEESSLDAASSVVESMLTRAVADSRADLGTLARVRGGGESPPKLPPADAALSREFTMTWTGPADTAVKEVCRLVDYRFEENGRKRVQYPSVVVTVTNRAAYYVLEDLSWQVRPHYVLSVDTARRVVTLSGAGGTGADPVPESSAPAKQETKKKKKGSKGSR
jgi:hypothetical protein